MSHDTPQLTSKIVRNVLRRFVPPQGDISLPLDLLACSLVSPTWHQEAWQVLEDPRFRVNLEKPPINHVLELKRYADLLLESHRVHLEIKVPMVKLPIPVKLLRHDNGPLCVAFNDTLVTLLKHSPLALREMDILLSNWELMHPRVVQQIPFLIESLIPHCDKIRYFTLGAEEDGTPPPPLLNNMLAGLADHLQGVEFRRIRLDTPLRHALRACTVLQEASFFDIGIDDIVELLHGWPDLRRFSLCTNSAATQQKTDKLAMKLGTCCRKLEEFNIASLDEFGSRVGVSNDALSYLVIRCTGLRRLSVHLNRNLNHIFLAALTDGARNLRHLYFRRCPELRWAAGEQDPSGKENSDGEEDSDGEEESDGEESEGEEESGGEKKEGGKKEDGKKEDGKKEGGEEKEGGGEGGVEEPWWPELETLVVRDCPHISRVFVERVVRTCDRLRKVVLTPREDDGKFKDFMRERRFVVGEGQGDAEVWVRMNED